MLPLKMQLQLRNRLFGFDFVNDNLPSYFQSFFSYYKNNEVNNEDDPEDSNDPHNTRSSPLRFNIPETTSVKYGKYNVVSNVVRDWNLYHDKLNIGDLKSSSKCQFKNHLHQYLLTKFAEN